MYVKLERVLLKLTSVKWLQRLDTVGGIYNLKLLIMLLASIHIHMCRTYKNDS